MLDIHGSNVCPYCQGLLEEGTFRSWGGNFFLPAGETVPALATEGEFAKKRAIRVQPSGSSLENPRWPAAYVCRSCKKIILPYG